MRIIGKEHPHTGELVFVEVDQAMLDAIRSIHGDSLVNTVIDNMYNDMIDEGLFDQDQEIHTVKLHLQQTVH